MKPFSCFVVACLLASSAWAADDPFSGKWKLNEEKSKFTGERLQVQDLGGNKYKLTSGNTSDTIVFDGTDQPVRFGRTMSVAPEGRNKWKMVIKKDGRVLSSMTHTISDDGKSQTIQGTETKPDGTTSDFNVVRKRVGGGSGWEGTWESTDVKFTSPDEWDIGPYEGTGLTFNTPAYQDTLSMKFDGRYYEEKGPNVPPGSMSAGRRLNAHTLDVTDKIKDHVMDHTRFVVSPDGKTLTLTVRETGQQKPLIIVYNKI